MKPEEKREEIRPCPHDLAEQETACAFDGLCPICLKQKITSLKTALRKAVEAIEFTIGDDGPLAVSSHGAVKMLIDALAAIRRELGQG